MGLYDYDIAQIAGNITPPNYRSPIFLAWLKALGVPLQWVRDNFYNEYVGGSTAPLWNSATSYVAGNKVRDTNNAIYQCVIANTNKQPRTNSDASSLTSQWVKISVDFRGTEERVKYNGSHLVLEYILNRFFQYSVLAQPLVFRQPTAFVAQNATPSLSYYTPKADIFIDINIIKNFAFIFANDISASFFKNNKQENFYMNDFDFGANNLTIYVPNSGGSPNPGWWTAFNADGNGEQRIRATANRYVIAGLNYDIQTY